MADATVAEPDPELTSFRARLAAFANVPPALRLLIAATPALAAGVAVARVIAALLPFAALLVTKRIIDLVVAVTEHHAPLARGHAWTLLGAGFALAAGGIGLGRLIDYLEARMSDQFSRAISLRVLQHAATLDLASFEDAAFYDRLERARVQATDRGQLLTAAGSAVQRAIGLLSLCASVAYYAPWLLGLLFVCLVPTLLRESQLAAMGYALDHKLTPIRRELDYLLVLGSSRESAKEVRIFGLADHLRDRYRAASDTLLRANAGLLRRRLVTGATLAVLGSIGYYGGYVYLVWQALAGAISVGTLTFLAGAVATAQVELQTLFTLFTTISQQALFLSDLLLFLRVRPALSSPSAAKRAPRPIVHGVVFEDVSFSYPAGPPVLDHLNLSIRAGEHVAIVGENGGGKTTLVKLVARLYDPTAGRILLDGVDLREYDLDDLRRQIGVIFQDFFRYDMPVRENVGAGRVDRVDDDRALWSALERGGADEIVARLPHGLEQMLGRRFEGGVDLSGGQWQALALARAYLREAQVLVLDEPTAALDARAEAEVFDRFASLTADRTAILISHRFSTVRMAQRIVLLHAGRIAEEGTHDALVSAGGRYARLFELQASNYR